MLRRIVPGGLRARLVIAISLITIAVVGGSFFALHQGTGADLRNRIDQDLRAQYREFAQQNLKGVHSRHQLTKAGKRFLASQRYHPESRIFAIEVSHSGPVVTNQREVVQHEIERNERQHKNGGSGSGEEVQEIGGATLLEAPPGLSTVSTSEAGSLRVYSHRIVSGGRRLGTFRVADPLNPVTEAQAGLRSTFLIVGALALLASVAIGLWVATLITRPLRRMARFAQAVDAGDLTERLDTVEGSNEARSLAESFNHMLDRLEDAFGRQREFVADASHELRTPLTLLRGEIELQQATGEPPDDERTAKLLRELDRMDRLVNDMLTLANAESGTLVHRRAVDLDDFLSDLRRDLPLFGPRDYRLEGAPRGVIEADPDRLAQVLRNLVRNAVAHTDADGRITVGAAPVDGTIEFSVADDGPGISPAQLDRLFDRFYRTDSARVREVGGSGLGLAIARAIVEAHGGRIWAESSPGHGAKIRFVIPGYSRGAANR